MNLLVGNVGVLVRSLRSGEVVVDHVVVQHLGLAGHAHGVQLVLLLGLGVGQLLLTTLSALVAADIDDSHRDENGHHEGKRDDERPVD